MKRRTNILWALIPILSVLTLHCGVFPTKSDEGPCRFNINVRYIDQKDSGNFSWFNDQESSAPSKLAKPGSIGSIDMIRVMVLDFSKYKSVEEFMASDEYHEFSHLEEEWNGDLSHWSEWERLFGRALSIASNQTISVDADTAHGSVPGVTGLNYFIVALLEDDLIQYAGGAEAVGKEGQTAEVIIELDSWDYYYYYDYYDDYGYY